MYLTLSMKNSHIKLLKLFECVSIGRWFNSMSYRISGVLRGIKGKR